MVYFTYSSLCWWRQIVCFEAKEKEVKNWQLPGIEPGAPNLRCQCFDHQAATTRQPPVLTILSIYCKWYWMLQFQYLVCTVRTPLGVDQKILTQYGFFPDGENFLVNPQQSSDNRTRVPRFDSQLLPTFHFLLLHLKTVFIFQLRQDVQESSQYCWPYSSFWVRSEGCASSYVCTSVKDIWWCPWKYFEPHRFVNEANNTMPYSCSDGKSLNYTCEQLSHNQYFMYMWGPMLLGYYLAMPQGLAHVLGG